MAVNPKSSLPNEFEIINDDGFRISIPDVLAKHKVQDEIQLTLALDDNGYAGRNHVIRIHRFGFKTDEYRVKIYLPDSRLTYLWPWKTNYSPYANNKNIEAILKTLPENTYNLVKELYSTNSKAEEIMSRYVLDKKTGLLYRNFLKDSKLVRNRSPVLLTKYDAIEIASNLFKY